MIYGLPTPVSARLLDTSESQLHLSLNLSNTLNDQRPTDENLFVDAETYQLNLIYDYGLNKRWMLRLQLPLIRHSGGFMDSWIDRFHELTNLPEDIRPFHPTDRIGIRYSRNNQDLLSISQAESGIGDIALQIAYQAEASGDSNLSYWFSVELPSGDSDKLTGNGATDIAAWLALDRQLVDDLWTYANIGAVYITDSDVLTAQHKDSALFSTVGLQFQARDSVQLKLQLDAHSAFYDSNAALLGRVIQLSFGASLYLDQTSSLDLAVAEDVVSGASPDVNINISWHRRF